jgi:hypothetical protein
MAGCKGGCVLRDAPNRALLRMRELDAERLGLPERVERGGASFETPLAAAPQDEGVGWRSTEVGYG